MNLTHEGLLAALGKSLYERTLIIDYNLSEPPFHLASSFLTFTA
jgi:hypothetical protein